MKKIIGKCLTRLRAAPVKTAEETKAESSVAANAKARRKRKTRFRLTATKYKNQKLRPAFNAFEVKEKTAYGTQTTVISPEDGIHSLNWAIFYIDVVGSGLLYRWATWDFSSPDHMCRYLSTINPAHKEVVRNIHVKFHAITSAQSPPAAFFKLLASLKNLTRLRLTITIHKDLLVPLSKWQMAAPPPREFLFLKPQTIEKLKSKKWAMVKDTPLQQFELRLLPHSAWGQMYHFNPSLIRNGDYSVKILEKEILGLIKGEEGDNMAVEDPDYLRPTEPRGPSEGGDL